LSLAHARLLAEPQPNPARGEVDWYAEGDGPAEPLESLPPDRRAAAQAVLDRLTGEIRALAARLRAEPSESRRFLGEMLERALQIPDPGSIRVRGDTPVLVAWGHVRLGETAGQAAVLGLAKAAPVAMPILPPPTLPGKPRAPAWPWFAALAVALLLLVPAIWLVLDPPGGAGPPICQLPDDDLAALRDWRVADARNADLRAQLAALVSQAGNRRLHCPVPPPTRRVQTPPPSQDANRAQQRGGQTGNLQIILAWDSRSDLDLHILCPNNEEISFQHRRACGGLLDLDANADANHSTNTPVENAFWATPPPGSIGIYVDPYELRGEARTPFRVTIRREGQPDRIVQGVAVAGRRSEKVTDVLISAPVTPP
jgi:hypothetical protein